MPLLGIARGWAGETCDALPGGASSTGGSIPPREQLGRELAEADGFHLIAHGIAIRAGPHQKTAVRREGFPR